MKVGLSTYSLSRAYSEKEMDIFGVIQWIRDNGGEHAEISPPAELNLAKNPEMTKAIRQKAKDCGIDISSYTIGASFIQSDKTAFETEIKRVMKEVDVANALGVKLMRHDAASRPIPECGIEQFEKDLPKIVEACARIADHAKQYGITTSVENHGFFMQKSDRVRRLVSEVGRPNFKTTIDIGNFMCADENPVAAVKNNISIASHIHFKDFYFRPFYANPGEGWFQTLSGNFLRGAIVGQGDIDIRAVLKIIKESGYGGYLSIEFEGMEECKLGSRIGMANVKRFLKEM